MALLWFDGFESYTNSADMLAMSNILTASLYGVSASYGRRSSVGVYLHNAEPLSINIPEQPSTIVVGFAFYINGTTPPSYSAAGPLVAFMDQYAGGVNHLKFFVKPDRNIEVRNGANAILATSSGILAEGLTWCYIEIKAVISDTVGQITINMNGTEVLSTTSDLDTLNGSNAYVGVVQLRNVVNFATWYDDLYILDNTGDAPHNDFLGDIRVDVVRPDGAGTHTDFTPSAGANYQNVDETYPDDNSTYNDGDTVGYQDSYNMGALPAPSGTTIYGFKSQITVRKTDAGARKCKLLTIAGTTEDLGSEISLSDTFTTHTKVFEHNPDDSADWEDADINAVQVGVEVTA